MRRFVGISLSLIGFASMIVLASCGGGKGSHSVDNFPTPLVISTNPLPPAGMPSIPYSFTFTATRGGIAPFTWRETGALPPGMIFSNGGVLSGTPTTAGSFPITVTVKDKSSPQQTALQGFTIVINNPPPPVINTRPTPPSGTVNTSYPGFTFTATGGLAPLSWSETGALPPGMVFSNSGVLSGTPTAAGSFPITVMSQDSLGQNAAPQDFTIEVLISRFTATGSMGTARVSHTATLLDDGRVLIVGGVDGIVALETAEVFTPTNGSFARTGNMSTARESHTATLLKNGKVLVTGGENEIGSLSTAELFDPENGAFTATGSMETERKFHTATLLNNGKVLVTGGLGSSGDMLATAELFDPNTGSFMATGSMASARFFHTATLLSDGRVLITGGGSGAELFDPIRETFTATGTMDTERHFDAVSLLSSGQVLVTGGFGVNSPPLETAELFDPGKGTFAFTGSMTTARARHTATLQNDGTVLVAGGVNLFVVPPGCTRRCMDELVATSSAELFDPTSGGFPRLPI